jgi:hypothetical protein
LKKSDKTKLYNSAVKLWGVNAQVDMAIEEASELIKAICKLKRSGNSLETVSAVAEEIADVEIMIEQLKIMLCCRDDVENWKKYKIERLSERIEEAEKKHAN